MPNQGRFSISPVFICAIALALSLAFFSCDSPTAPDFQTQSGLDGSGEIDPGATGAFLLGTVSDTAFAPGSLEIWAMDVAFDDSMGMVTFDVQIKNQTERTISPPIRFVVTNITPRDVSAVDFDGVSSDGLPFYDFSAKLGGDNVLTPGEWTERVTMKFHTVTARSFAIGFRIDLGPPAGLGVIGGVVFLDANENGLRDRECRCEPGIPGITVALEKKLQNGDMVTLITRTDSMGEYRFTGLNEGVYKVFVAPPPNMWRITSPNPLLVTLVQDGDGDVQNFLGAHFGLVPLFQPEITLFGPITIGSATPYGMDFDSTFVNPPSPLTVVFNYYLEIDVPVDPATGVIPNNIDWAVAWINDEKVFEYIRPYPPDTAYFVPQTVRIRDGLVVEGTNDIHLKTFGNAQSAATWRVYKKP